MTKKSKKGLGSYLYDHYLATLSAVLGIFGLGILYLFRSLVVDFVQWQYSGWVTLGILLLAFMAGKITVKNRSKRSVAHVVVGPPRIRRQEFDPIVRYGVIWMFWRGNNIPGAFDYALGDAPLRSWVDGPFCKQCDYELERNNKGTKWVCANGHKDVSIPGALRGDVRDRVIKIFDAELRKLERGKE